MSKRNKGKRNVQEPQVLEPEAPPQEPTPPAPQEPEAPPVAANGAKNGPVQTLVPAGSDLAALIASGQLTPAQTDALLAQVKALKAQQNAQKKAQTTARDEGKTAVVKFLSDAILEAVDAGMLPPDFPQITVRVSPTGATQVTRTKNDGPAQATERKQLNAAQLAEAGLDAFLIVADDGSVTEPVTVIGTRTYKAHPVCYLTATAPEGCFYDRDCPVYAQENAAGAVTFTPVKNEAGETTVYTCNSETLTAHQKQVSRLSDGKFSAAQVDKVKQDSALRHGDAAARLLVVKGMVDTRNRVRVIPDKVRARLADVGEPPAADAVLPTEMPMSMFIKYAVKTAPTLEPEAAPEAAP